MATVIGGGGGNGPEGRPPARTRTLPPPQVPSGARGVAGTGPELVTPPLVVRRREEEETVVTFPALIFREFLAGLAIFALLMLISIFVNAPLLQRANTAITPNPAKAPWYFLGLQELLQRFPPIMAGVAFPTFVITGMILTPYLDKNPSRRPQDRKVAVTLFTLYAVLAVAFVIVGVFFRAEAFTWDWLKVLGHPGVNPEV
jgi:quinol-cytochrome oxidoreductase complex cytochrome b subunit